MTPTPINAILSLDLVRPAISDDNAPWIFCLRLSAAFNAQSFQKLDDPSDWTALLPWNLFAASDLKGIFFDSNGPLPKPILNLKVNPPGTVFPSFIPALKDDTQQSIKNLIANSTSDYPVEYGWAAGGPTTVSTGSKNLSLPGLLKTLASLPPDLSQALRAAWYFQVPYDSSLAGKYILVTPAKLTDLRNGQQYALDEANIPKNLTSITSSTYQCPYLGGQVFTTGMIVSLKTVDKKKNLPARWFNIKDGDGRSVANISNKVSQALDEVNRIAAVDCKLLADALTIESNGSNLQVPAPLDIAKYLLANANFERPGLTPDQYRERRNKILDKLKALKNFVPASPQDTPQNCLKKALALDIQSWWAFSWPPQNNEKAWASDLLTQALLSSSSRSAASIEYLQNVKSIQLANDKAGKLADTLLDQLFPSEAIFPDAKPAQTPTLPNEVISLLLGDLSQSLVHFESNLSEEDAELAGAGLLVRRGADSESIKSSPWRLVTAKIPVVDGNGDLASRPFGSNDNEIGHSGQPLASYAPIDFIDNVRRSELTYRGENLGVQSALAFIHRQRVDKSNSQTSDQNKVTRISSLSYQPPGALGKKAPNAKLTACPPLRYGDYYDFAAFKVNRSGAFPEMVTVLQSGQAGANGYSPDFDWSKLSDPNLFKSPDAPPDAVFSARFARRVPVGELNLLPGRTNAPVGARWPATPADIALRAPEWLEAKLSNDAITAKKERRPNRAPVLVLGEGKRFRDVVESYTFTVGLPRVDEFTFSRWAMPPVGSSSNDAQPLIDELKRIHRERDALLAIGADPDKADTLLPAEQAISAYGIRAWLVHRDGTQDLNVVQKTIPVPTPDPNKPYIRNPLSLALSWDQSGTASKIGDPVGNSINISVLEGEFYAIELVPLVSAVDFARFDQDAMKYLVTPWKDGENSYQAFESTWILVEAVTDLLPKQSILYDNFRLELDPAGAVHVSLKSDAIIENIAFADSFILSRQRWVWRNRPLVDPDPDAGVPTDPSDAPRLAAGGLPYALLADNPAGSCDSNKTVLRFDALAKLDTGLIGRSAHEGRLPRAPGGAPLNNMLLAVDDRDGVNAAEYLRYELTVRSRYASIILDSTKQQTIATNTSDIAKNYGDTSWRRIAMPYRGNPKQIKPLKIFTILPMTRLPQESPYQKPALGDPTPFVVVLDEVWFREYGQGERLEAYLALEPSEIGMGRSSDDFHGKDITNWPLLASRFKGARAKAVDFLWQNFSAQGQEKVIKYNEDPSPANAKIAIEGLLNELNKIIKNRDPLQDQTNFTEFAKDTEDLLEQKPADAAAKKQLYRMLIEDTFPREFVSVWRPYRAAPLPDHYTTPANSNEGESPYYQNAFGVEEPTPDDPPALPLNVFGPFGYTLDQSDDQALANATAYIVYPPKDVKPNWWMGVRMRRRLDHFDSAGTMHTSRSDQSDVRHFYTRPGNIVSLPDPAKSSLHLTGNSVDFVDMQINPDLFPKPTAPAVRTQYAWVLLLGRTVIDGGHGADIFLPTQGGWLIFDTNNKPTFQIWGEKKLDSTTTTGRIALLLLNGRSDSAPPKPLLDPKDLSSFFRSLLPASTDPNAEQDCPAMIVGISDQFPVDAKT